MTVEPVQKNSDDGDSTTSQGNLFQRSAVLTIAHIWFAEDTQADIASMLKGRTFRKYRIFNCSQLFLLWCERWFLPSTQCFVV